MIRDSDSKGGEVYSGFVIDLIKEVGRRAGFDYELIQNEDGLIGAPRGGKWVGVIGDVESGVSSWQTDGRVWGKFLGN